MRLPYRSRLLRVVAAILISCVMLLVIPAYAVFLAVYNAVKVIVYAVILGIVDPILQALEFIKENYHD